MGIINPKYFENSIIRIPIIIDAVFTIEVDAEKEDDVMDTVTYHITGVNSFFKTHSQLKPGTKVRCILYCSKFSSPVFEGMVALDTHEEDERFKGTLLRFTSRPLGFWVFLFKYYLYRLMRGIVFNLRLPGSRVIRELFVRPVSVMQDKESHPAGHVIFKQGDTGNRFYLIQNGKVDIVKTFKTGKKVLMTTLTRGDIFGEIALVGNQPRLATAVCKSDCLLAVAEPENLDALIKENPFFAQKLIESLATRFQETDTIMFKNISQMSRSMRKGRSILYAVMKLLLAGSKAGGAGEVMNIEVDIDFIAQTLQCEREKVAELIRILNESDTAEELLEGLDKELYSRILKVCGPMKVTIGENK